MNSISAAPPGPAGQALAPRRRLAIVSTYDELCGIAGYTRALERQLAGSFEIGVMDLDQYLLRSPHRAVQKLADRHIGAIAAQLAGFDAVNIQLEFGTLGVTTRQIVRRFARLCRAAGQLSVTFHTILPADRFDWGAWFKLLRRLRLMAALDLIVAYRRGSVLTRGIYNVLKRRQRIAPTRVIVHTRRDMRLLRDVFGLNQVLHHPLSFVMPQERAQVRATVTRDNFALLRNLPPAAKLVGVFGFVSEYKGIDTALRAMRLLPPEHHLLIFGGIHPQTIRKHTPIDPYLRKLLDIAYVDRTLLDDFSERGDGAASLQLSIDAGSAGLLEHHPKSLVGRVHFMGALSDSEFVAAMAVCDCVVMAYQEVGQSASGPIAQALEMGCRVIASRTNAFLQFARYHPGQFEFFDIGNHLELAERLAAAPPIDCAARTLHYDWSTNVATYERAHASRQEWRARAAGGAEPVPQRAA
jgi:glycosyltransferase involved in cell wall biosynthesis